MDDKIEVISKPEPKPKPKANRPDKVESMQRAHDMKVAKFLAGGKY